MADDALCTEGMKDHCLRKQELSAQQKEIIYGSIFSEHNCFILVPLFTLLPFLTGKLLVLQSEQKQPGFLLFTKIIGPY